MKNNVSVKRNKGKILISIDEKEFFKEDFEDIYDAVMSEFILENEKLII